MGAPAALVFGREPRVSGEIYEDGNSVSYHLNVGSQGSDVSNRMRFRYFAKMEFIKAQAKSMLQRTVHARTRKLPKIPEVGRLVFFWRDTHKDRLRGSRWKGPACVVGHQGTNVWVTIGGRCCLVALEHLREMVGDESFYGDPLIQKDIALFKKVPEEATFEDLTDQKGPEEDLDEIQVDVEEFVENRQGQHEDPKITPTNVPRSVLRAANGHGWTKDDYGNPVLVQRKAWAFRIPTPTWDAKTLPYRTTWVFRNGKWKKLEDEVFWSGLEDPCAAFPDGVATMLITIFHGKTRKLGDIGMFLGEKRNDTKRMTMMWFS